MEDLKDPGEVLLPTGNHTPTILAVEESGAHVQFTLLANSLLPNRRQSSEIGTLVSETLGVRVPAPTHVVNCWIASSINGLSSSCCLPSNPRSRALHISTQDRPRPNKSSLLAVESCVNVNSRPIAAEWEGSHPDRGQEGTSRVESTLSW